MAIYVKNKTTHQKYQHILMAAGWYEGRNEDVLPFKQYANQTSVAFSEAIRSFLASYSNLSTAYLGFESSDSKAGFDFTFDLSVETAKKVQSWSDFKSILGFAKEKVLCIGLFGFYYPGVCAIGASGQIYIKHDYTDTVQMCSTMFDCIALELKHHDDLVFVSFEQEM